MVLRIYGVLLFLEHDSSIFGDFRTSFYDCYKTTRILGFWMESARNCLLHKNFNDKYIPKQNRLN